MMLLTFEGRLLAGHAMWLAFILQDLDAGLEAMGRLVLFRPFCQTQDTCLDQFAAYLGAWISASGT